MNRPPSRAPGAGSDPGTSDRGSVTPLIIGMMLCLLLLGAGITAAGSAFLAGQRLQHLCDGAAAAAADTLTGPTADNGAAATAVATYLATRNNPQISTDLGQNGATITLTCATDTPVTFGALFATPTLHRTVTANARTDYRQN